MQKSTSVVVPPNAAEVVPDVKSSQVTVPPKNISRCVCGSTAPGKTYLPAASITLSAATSSDSPRQKRSAQGGALSPSRRSGRLALRNARRRDHARRGADPLLERRLAVAAD